MPRVTRIVSNSQDEQKKKRTAAYCRVSTDSTDQINSLANQVRTYTKKINKNPEWELVDIFADEGLSGTSMNKRDDLLRLLDMCRHGLVDLIICKSISRFGRNTREVLETVRELKLLGIAVHFEKEGIYTLNLGDEMLLSTFAAIAEEESVAISHNVRFTIKKKMQNGTYVNGCVPYGFRLIDGVMIPYESEAIIIRLLFKHYLEGYSTPALVRWLEEEGVLTKNGNTKWNIRIVSRMLSNEKYVGDTLYQKKYKEPTVPFKQRINYGQEEQYYCTGTHQGIVDRETFDKVQALLQKRRATFAKRTHENYQFYPLSSKIRCKECGNVFRRRVSNGCISWGCSTHIADRQKCDSHYYKEERIYDSFIGIINCLRFGSFDILEETERLLQTAIVSKRRNNAEAMQASQTVAELNAKLLMLEQLNAKGYLAPEIYKAQANDIMQEISRVKEQRQEILDSRYESMLEEIKKLRRILTEQEEPLEEFDEDLFGAVVKKVEINNRDEITFTLLGDLAFTERL